jgi:hypothetical protein
MKKLLLFSTLLLSGCQVYEFPNETPRLTGGKWIMNDYDIVVINSISTVTPIKNDTICINSFNNQSFISGNILMKQNYNQTSKDRRFIKNKTTWEFDGNNTQLYCDYLQNVGTNRPEPFWINLHPSQNRLEVLNTTNGGSTNYTFETNLIGAAYPTTLTLLSPVISTDLYLSNGSRAKAVDVRIVLKFMR